MKELNYNGFCSEEQYEQVKDIIIEGIDEYTDGIMITCRTLMNGKKEVEVDVLTESGHDLTYHLDEYGVNYVNCEGPNFPIQECKILVALDYAAEFVFQIIDIEDRKRDLKKFLEGDESVLPNCDVIRDRAIEAKAKFEEAVVRGKKFKVETDVVRFIGGGAFTWQEDIIIPILEEHYGIELTKSGRKYLFFNSKDISNVLAVAEYDEHSI